MKEETTLARSGGGALTVCFTEAKTPTHRAQCYRLGAAEFGPPLSEAQYAEREEFLGNRPLAVNGGLRYWCLVARTENDVRRAAEAEAEAEAHENRDGDSGVVVACCKTVRREVLFVRLDGARHGSREEEGDGEEEKGTEEKVETGIGYCVASVVTDPRYRGYGLAGLLLRHLTAWLDGHASASGVETDGSANSSDDDDDDDDDKGNAVASMLYSEVDNFYEHRGWARQRVFSTTLTRKTSSRVSSTDTPPPDSSSISKLPATRILGRKDIPALCDEDSKFLRDNFKKLFVHSPTAGHQQQQQQQHHDTVKYAKEAKDTVIMLVLPTSQTITWLHDRAEFFGKKLHNRVPENFGSGCVYKYPNTSGSRGGNGIGSDTNPGLWLYWFHDFRKNQLAIQRVHIPLTEPQTDKEHVEAIATLLLDALEEAAKWNLFKVVFWTDAPYLSAAANLLVQRHGPGVEISAMSKERTGDCMTMVRWRGTEPVTIELPLDEFYSWN
ncbi:hypothetical protein F5Y16DRAFT_400185 [Xylariaceae sp. FL0255]|nr:hypothetical protein F5Y16DRAFT_400185 [Xylariaceae sp. FL0255]